MATTKRKTGARSTTRASTSRTMRKTGAANATARRRAGTGNRLKRR
jgi:hypothetical protein